MRLSLAIASLAALGLSACATIDFAQMAPAPEVAEVAPVQKNVVIRSAEALVVNFTNKGWAAAPDPKRIQRMANVLLRGIGQSEKVIDTSYAGKAKILSDVQRDIILASTNVAQTQKAADVFLAMAPEGELLQAELKSLEKALAACHKAELMFSRALEKTGAKDVKAEISAFSASLDNLKAVTNLYGDHVRANISKTGEAAS